MLILFIFVVGLESMLLYLFIFQENHTCKTCTVFSGVHRNLDKLVGFRQGNDYNVKKDL
jgi:hypothetical protein